MKICKIQNKEKSPEILKPFGYESSEKVAEFHKTIDEYCETPLVSLEGLSERLKVNSIYVKDESKRFGLNAFKGLGGSYAIHYLDNGENQTFITATDGNHGRGVAWAAHKLGKECYVYLPKGTAKERLENIQKLGAHAKILDLSYDDTVRYASDKAKENGWTLVQDTAFPGYEEIPTYIMQGYTTMGYEIVNQLNGKVPTHIFLQAGVGSMAAAMTAFFRDYYKNSNPIITIVEPDGANCFYKTALADDGKIHAFEGEMKTIMAGLCCGEPSPIAWDIIKDYADFALTCEDEVAANGMKALYYPVGKDQRMISGESGASGFGAFYATVNNPANEEIKKALAIDENSVILCLSTEGDTDKENFHRIISL